MDNSDSLPHYPLPVQTATGGRMKVTNRDVKSPNLAKISDFLNSTYFPYQLIPFCLPWGASSHPTTGYTSTNNTRKLWLSRRMGFLVGRIRRLEPRQCIFEAKRTFFISSVFPYQFQRVFTFLNMELIWRNRAYEKSSFGFKNALSMF